jgi:hypothetical protein
MSKQDPTEVLVAMHYDPPKGRAVLVSIDGDNTRAVWIAKSLIGSKHLTGKTTQGTDRQGGRVTLPLANLTIPEWLAIDRGFV